MAASEAELRGLRELQAQYPDQHVYLGRYGEAIIEPANRPQRNLFPEGDQFDEVRRNRLKAPLGQSSLLQLELEGV